MNDCTKTPTPELVNPEGLTWTEWHGAALAFGSGGIDPRGPYWSGELRKAWEAGEDPTEWAAYFGRRGAYPRDFAKRQDAYKR